MTYTKRTYRSTPEPRLVLQAVQNANGNDIPDLIDGKIPVSQLPGELDDIIEGYYEYPYFYKDAEHTKRIQGETGKLYVDKDTHEALRFSGSGFVSFEVSKVAETNTKQSMNIWVGTDDEYADLGGYHGTTIYFVSGTVSGIYIGSTKIA